MQSRLLGPSALLSLALICAAILGWILTFDDSSGLGTAVLGGYRDRRFLLNLGLSYCAVWAAALTLTRPTKLALFRIIAAHVALALPLGLAEIAAALNMIDFRAYIVAGEGHGARPDEVADPRLRRSSQPGQRFEGAVMPDLAAVLGAPAAPVNVVFQTDSNGLRNPRDKRDAHIILLGDSILVAGLLPIEDLMTERLERALGVTVMNVSESGFSPQEEWIRLEGLGLDLSGRLVVQLLFEGNDLVDSQRWRAWSNRPLRSSWPESGLTKATLKTLHRPRRRAGQTRIGDCRAGEEASRRVYFLYDAVHVRDSMAELEVLSEHLRSTNRILREAAGRYAVALVPFKLTTLHPSCTWPAGSALGDEALSSTDLPERLQEITEREGIPFLDLGPALRRANERQSPFFDMDTHLNSFGHEVCAEALAPWIQALLRRPATSG